MKKNRIWYSLIIITTLFILIQLVNPTSVQRTLFEEDRYKLFIDGTMITIILSFASIILGTLLAIPICMLRRSESQLLKLSAKTYISIIQGVPITLLLLIFYYVIFARVNISPIIVGIITFAIYFSAYVAEIIRGGLDAINHTQIEAGYAMGLSKWQTVIHIILPQMLVYTIPVYRGEAVSLIKLTSIASYISVIELTKVSDIVRNRIYLAFFPLIFTAFIYYILCYLTAKGLDIIHSKYNSRPIKRVI